MLLLLYSYDIVSLLHWNPFSRISFAAEVSLSLPCRWFTSEIRLSRVKHRSASFWQKMVLGNMISISSSILDNLCIVPSSVSFVKSLQN